MTWMPDRGGASSGRRHTSPQRSTHRPGWADELGFDGAEHPQRGAQRQLGISRILGRRARWVGARLRRET